MSKDIFLGYIKKHIDLNENEESIILSKIKERKYLKNQFLVQQGDVCRYICFIVSGCVRSYHIDDDGNEHTVSFSIENWWSSDMGSFITQKPADYNVECIEPTSLIQFDSVLMEELYKTIPKLERVFRIITQNALVSAQRRVVNTFSKTARERFEIFRENYPELEQRIPQYMIASYLGVTKEFLSKIKGQIARE
jgi:CRP-like cAMP-binding protein